MAHSYNGRRDDARSYGALQCERLVLLRVGDQKELYVAVPRPVHDVGTAGDEIVIEGYDEAAWQPAQAPVDNRLGQLLLPTCVPQADLDALSRHEEREALVMWDAQGRVHQVVLDECLFLTWMRLWAPPRYTKTRLWLERAEHDESRLYAAPPHTQLLLRLPPDTPANFRAWQPRPDLYDVEYDQLQRVFSVHSVNHASEADRTQIQLGGLWETRLHPLQREKK
jgi:hypothetical protein